jgi:hypothetical protein
MAAHAEAIILPTGGSMGDANTDVAAGLKKVASRYSTAKF